MFVAHDATSSDSIGLKGRGSLLRDVNSTGSLVLSNNDGSNFHADTALVEYEKSVGNDISLPDKVSLARMEATERRVRDLQVAVDGQLSNQVNDSRTFDVRIKSVHDSTSRMFNELLSRIESSEASIVKLSDENAHLRNYITQMTTFMHETDRQAIKRREIDLHVSSVLDKSSPANESVMQMERRVSAMFAELEKTNRRLLDIENSELKAKLAIQSRIASLEDESGNRAYAVINAPGFSTGHLNQSSSAFQALIEQEKQYSSSKVSDVSGRRGKFLNHDDNAANNASSAGYSNSGFFRNGDSPRALARGKADPNRSSAGLFGGNQVINNDSSNGELPSNTRVSLPSITPTTKSTITPTTISSSNAVRVISTTASSAAALLLSLSSGSLSDKQQLNALKESFLHIHKFLLELQTRISDVESHFSNKIDKQDEKLESSIQANRNDIKTIGDLLKNRTDEVEKSFVQHRGEVQRSLSALGMDLRIGLEAEHSFTVGVDVSLRNGLDRLKDWMDGVSSRTKHDMEENISFINAQLVKVVQQSADELQKLNDEVVNSFVTVNRQIEIMNESNETRFNDIKTSQVAETAARLVAEDQASEHLSRAVNVISTELKGNHSDLLSRQSNLNHALNVVRSEGSENVRSLSITMENKWKDLSSHVSQVVKSLASDTGKVDKDAKSSLEKAFALLEARWKDILDSSVRKYWLEILKKNNIDIGENFTNKSTHNHKNFVDNQDDISGRVLTTNSELTEVDNIRLKGVEDRLTSLAFDAARDVASLRDMIARAFIRNRHLRYGRKSASQFDEVNKSSDDKMQALKLKYRIMNPNIKKIKTSNHQLLSKHTGKTDEKTGFDDKAIVFNDGPDALARIQIPSRLGSTRNNEDVENLKVHPHSMKKNMSKKRRKSYYYPEDLYISSHSGASSSFLNASRTLQSYLEHLFNLKLESTKASFHSQLDLVLDFIVRCFVMTAGTDGPWRSEEQLVKKLMNSLRKSIINHREGNFEVHGLDNWDANQADSLSTSNKIQNNNAITGLDSILYGVNKKSQMAARNNNNEVRAVKSSHVWEDIVDDLEFRNNNLLAQHQAAQDVKHQRALMMVKNGFTKELDVKSKISNNSNGIESSPSLEIKNEIDTGTGNSTQFVLTGDDKEFNNNLPSNSKNETFEKTISRLSGEENDGRLIQVDERSLNEQDNLDEFEEFKPPQ